MYFSTIDESSTMTFSIKSNKAVTKSYKECKINYITTSNVPTVFIVFILTYTVYDILEVSYLNDCSVILVLVII